MFHVKHFWKVSWIKIETFVAGNYDVIVVGAGHAGCEAALAAARLGANTILLTMSIDSVALAPCNPSVGGPAKGVLVREIDALGGAMAHVADMSQIQVRLLNTGKGPAVQALRAQIDKKEYQQNMLKYLENAENLDLKQAEVVKVLVEDGKVYGVETLTGSQYLAPKVILTAGTYLKGKIITGNCTYPSGPAGLPPSMPLSDSLTSLGIKLERFKTGTPARVDKKSLDFSKMSEQAGETSGLYFSFEKKDYNRPMVPCWLTYTTLETHRIIKENMHRCPLYSGLIEGVGPRYCPSIEDKIVRFAHRDSHQLFLEPEGLYTDEYYVQGMSTSLPEDVQLAFYRTIPGMENVRIVRPAYAIEYDAVQPTQLDNTLQVKTVEGLYTAGQLNGSSGYEEAAAQGLWAGANAALAFFGREPFFVSRANGYIGVMVDDLVTKGVREPYRLFTSLSEYRLVLRNDNADARLVEYAHSVGLNNQESVDRYNRKKVLIEAEIERLKTARVSPNNLKLKAFVEETGICEVTRGFSAWEYLARPEFNYDSVLNILDETPTLPIDVIEQVVIEAKYSGYIKKQVEQVNKFNKAEKQRIPADIDYTEIRALSNEAMQKLDNIRPESIGQASRITGISPADIGVLLIWIEKMRRGRGKDVSRETLKS